MKQITLCLLLSIFVLQSLSIRAKTKRVHRAAPERELLFDYKDEYRREQESSQHENMIMMMKMMKRQEQIKRIQSLVNQFQQQMDELQQQVSSEVSQLGSMRNQM